MLIFDHYHSDINSHYVRRDTRVGQVVADILWDNATNAFRFAAEQGQTFTFAELESIMLHMATLELQPEPKYDYDPYE